MHTVMQLTDIFDAAKDNGTDYVSKGVLILDYVNNLERALRITEYVTRSECTEE